MHRQHLFFLLAPMIPTNPIIKATIPKHSRDKGAK